VAVRGQHEGARKLLVCKECGSDFAVERSPGSYPSYCDECRKVKRQEWRNAINVNRRAERDTRSESMRERNAQGLAQKASAARWQRPDPEPRRQDLMRSIMRGELDQVMVRADGRRLAARNDLRRDVRTLAYAMGDEDTYHALLDIAADALAWATRIRPDGSALNVPTERPVEDYGELMVA
jgi:hypothetical protein